MHKQKNEQTKKYMDKQIHRQNNYQTKYVKLKKMSEKTEQTKNLDKHFLWGF